MACASSDLEDVPQDWDVEGGVGRALSRPIPPIQDDLWLREAQD